MNFDFEVVNGVWLRTSSFFMNPVVYLSLLFVWMEYRRQSLFERKLFSIRINSPLHQMLESVFYGLLGGVVISLFSLGLGFTIQPSTMIIVGILSLVLSCFHIEYLCVAYAGGIVGLLASAVHVWPQGKDLPVLSSVWPFLTEIHIPSLLALIALLHLLEAFFIHKNTGRGASPLLISAKRGLLVGAYHWQRFWFIPFVSITAVSPMDGHIFPNFGWWSVFGNGPASGLAFVFLPVVSGFTYFSISSLPREQARKSSRSLVLYSLILLGMSIAAYIQLFMGVAAALFALVGHAGIIRLMNGRERKLPPMFAPLEHGVRILAVIPKTPAAKLGIQQGEILLRANGRDVNCPEDFYPALQLHSTFCKLEVLNDEGNIKYLQCSLYQGEHHQLGLIFAPGAQTSYYVDMKPVNILQLIRQQTDQGA